MNTSQETFSKQVPVALAAVLAHVIENDLRFENAHINTDAYDQQLDICLFGLTVEEHARWIESLIIHDETNEHVRDLVLRSTWQVQLPDTGVRFTLVTYRDAPLSLVSA